VQRRRSSIIVHRRRRRSHSSSSSSTLHFHLARGIQQKRRRRTHGLRDSIDPSMLSSTQLRRPTIIKPQLPAPAVVLLCRRSNARSTRWWTT
jgi:hypothetical protein